MAPPWRPLPPTPQSLHGESDLLLFSHLTFCSAVGGRVPGEACHRRAPGQRARPGLWGKKAAPGGGEDSAPRADGRGVPFGNMGANPGPLSRVRELAGGHAAGTRPRAGPGGVLVLVLWGASHSRGEGEAVDP